MITPEELQQVVLKKTGVQYHITHVRRIMREYNLTPKSADRIHVNCETPDIIRRWQWSVRRKILRLKKKGFVIGVQDKAFFIHDTITGRKYRSPVAMRIFLLYRKPREICHIWHYG